MIYIYIYRMKRFSFVPFNLFSFLSLHFSFLYCLLPLSFNNDFFLLSVLFCISLFSLPLFFTLFFLSFFTHIFTLFFFILLFLPHLYSLPPPTPSLSIRRSLSFLFLFLGFLLFYYLIDLSNECHQNSNHVKMASVCKFTKLTQFPVNIICNWALTMIFTKQSCFWKESVWT